MLIAKVRRLAPLQSQRGSVKSSRLHGVVEFVRVVWQLIAADVCIKIN
jgi:hypothetical protein